MKKTASLFLTVLLMLALTACGGGSGKNSSYAKLTDYGALHYDLPEGIVEAEVYIEKNGESVFESNLIFVLDNDEKVTLACSPGTILEDEIPVDQFDTVTINGIDFYSYTSENEHMLFLQKGEDLYGVDISASGDESTLYDDFTKGIKLTDKTSFPAASDDLGGIKYEFGDSLNVCSTISRTAQSAEGKMIRNTSTWIFGKSADEADFRFSIALYKDTDTESMKSEDRTYSEAEINGNTFVVQENNGDEPFYYMLQHGDDVYVIRNLGISNGWWVSRSDESIAAFGEFLKTISF